MTQKDHIDWEKASNLKDFGPEMFGYKPERKKGISLDVVIFSGLANSPHPFFCPKRCSLDRYQSHNNHLVITTLQKDQHIRATHQYNPDPLLGTYSTIIFISTLQYQLFNSAG